MGEHLFNKGVLSILIPVYNERAFLRRSVEKVMAVELPRGLRKEIIMVDDCSSDGTGKIIEELAAKYDCIRTFRQEYNQGKGAAIARAIKEMSGEYAIVQDADLEYDPQEYPLVLKPLIDGHADVVYGSRFATRQMRRVIFYHHKLGNLFLTHLSNFMTGLDLTDMETCYKAFRADVLKTIPIRSKRFGIEPEITAKIAKRGCRIFEVPISYYGRGYSEGKKIGWKDGVQAIYTIFKYRFIDDCYEDTYGRRHLMDFTNSRMGSVRLAEQIEPYMGDTIIEIGAGIGNLSRRLPKKEKLTVCESAKEGECLEILRSIFADNDLVDVVEADICEAGGMERAGKAQTVVCANLLQFVEDDTKALGNLLPLLEQDGRLVLSVPCNPSLFGDGDKNTGALRRYSSSELRKKLTEAGYEVDKIWSFNFPAYLLHLLSFKFFKAGKPGKWRIKLSDMLQSIFRPLEKVLPLPGACLVAVARKAGTE